LVLVGAWMITALLTLVVFDLVTVHHIYLLPFWWAFPLLQIAVNVRNAWRVPHRTKADVLMAALFLPLQVYAAIQTAWFAWSWAQVLTNRKPDLWAAQIAAERG
jgi:poly-beta-1,6-N-acetyl-D-glucosamine synthase